jgi:hypothetical protein
LLVDDLGVGEEETCLLVLDAGLHENALDVLAPGFHAVVFYELNEG